MVQRLTRLFFNNNLSCHFFALSTFFLLSVFFIFSWFEQGLIYGGGDVGLQTFNPQRILEIARFIWWGTVAPGVPVPQGLTSIPFNFAFSILQSLGFSPLLLQASLFFLILFFCGIGMYFLVLFLFEDRYKNYAILAGLFYTVNPYMMISVWHRFVHPTFFFVAALPFFTIFWLKWIRYKNPIALLIFLLTNLISLYAFGTIAYILTLWLFLFLVTIPDIIFPWQGLKNLRKILLVFFIGFFFWVLTNAWWLVPIFKISPASLSEQHSNEETLLTLVNISRQTILPYSLQMINPFYLFYQLDFGKSYENIFIRLLPWIFVSIILIGLIRALINKDTARWALIYLAVIFFAKGAAPPLGFAYIFALKYFFPLGVLRNPFEKIGILLPLVSTILFIVGLKFAYESLKYKFSGKVAGIFLIVTFGAIFLFCLPLFKGQIFGRFDKPAFVDVPQSYQDADNWIKSDYAKNKNQNPGRILHLPLTRGESISYNWEYGYSGLEPSNTFFTAAPSISHGFNLKRVDDSLTALYFSFHKFTDNPDKILKILQDFNVRYIVLHKDVNWLGGDLFDPLKSEELLNNLYFIKRTQTFGDLVIYKIPDEYFKPKITLVSNFQLIYLSNNSLIWPYLLGNESSMITPVDGNLDNNISNLTTRNIIFPNASFIYPKKSFVLAVVNQLPTDESALNLLLTQFTRIKPILAQNGEFQSEELNDKLISSTEKIVKIPHSQILGNGISKSLLDDYQQSIEDILSKNLRDSRLLLYISESDMSLIFQVHLTLLETVKEKADNEIKLKIEKIDGMLKSWMLKNNFIPANELSLDSDKLIDRQKVFRFQIPKDGSYEILITDATLDNLDKFKLSINGEVNELIGKSEGGVLSFGNHFFHLGDWELGYDVQTSSNLALPFDKLIKFGNITEQNGVIRVETQGQYGYIESQIPNVKGGDVYRISFEILGQNVQGFYFQLAQDIDSVNEGGQKINQLNEFIDLTKAGSNWQNYQSILLPLKLTTQQAALRFVIASTGQLPPPAIMIRNLKIEKVLNSDIVLRSIQSKDNTEENGGQILNIDQKNPTLYKGRVEVKKPSFLIFSETYHPGWKLKLTEGNNTYLPQKHMMANLYGNAYFIDKMGNYDFVLEFELQRIVNIGAIIAALSYITSIVLIGWNKFRR